MMSSRLTEGSELSGSLRQPDLQGCTNNAIVVEGLSKRFEELSCARQVS